MSKKWFVAAAALVFATSWLTFLSCSKKQAGPTGSDSTPATLQVSPSHGAPGSPLEITGYQLNPADTGITMLIGGYPTVFVSDSSSLNALVPLCLDSGDTWPNVPSGPQDVVIIRGTDTLARGSGILSIDSLRHSDGATLAITEDLKTIAHSLSNIYGSLPQIPGEDARLEGYRQAFVFMLDSMVAGTDSSLQAILDGSSSWTGSEVPDLALQDAIMASCGMLDFYDGFAASVGQVSKRVSDVTQSSIFCRSGGPDMDLACQMQIYVILEDYKNDVVKPTAQTYNENVKLGADLIAITGLAKPAILIINALMQVWEFVYGNLAPALFPAEITDFSLTLQSDTIGLHEPTISTISITAKNHPSTIKATEILDLLIEASGLAKAPAGIIVEFHKILENTIEYALTLYRKCLVAYNNEHGGSVFIDPEGTIPELTWGPVTINHSDLVELFSYDPNIIKGDTAILEWIGIAKGDGTIQARGRSAGEQAKVLIDHALCLPCVYSGGAFGNDVPGTENKTVVVGKPATLNVVITGLMAGVDGSVIVDGPNGYSSGLIVSNTTLSNLETGDYHITAINVADGPYEYVPKPVDTTVTLADEDNTTVTINYEAKYGSLLVTVSGLPSGVDADIDLTGNGTSVHIVSDTLIDSLYPGSYTVVARDVYDAGNDVTLAANPPQQTVEVKGRETATCAVDYGNDVVMELFVGQSHATSVQKCLTAIAHYEYYHVSDLTHTYDTSKTSDCNLEALTEFCNGNGDLTGGSNGNLTISASTLGNSVTGSMNFAKAGDSLVTVTIDGSSSSQYVLNGDTLGYHWDSRAYAMLSCPGYSILAIKNLGANNLQLTVSLDVSGQSDGAQANYTVQWAPFGSCPPTDNYNDPIEWLAMEYVGNPAGPINVHSEKVFTIYPHTVQYYRLHIAMSIGTIASYYYGGPNVGGRVTQTIDVSGKLSFQLKKQ